MVINEEITCTCREWIGIEQRPQALRWHSESTIPALPNTINLFSSSSWETVKSTRDMPDPESNTNTFENLNLLRKYKQKGLKWTPGNQGKWFRTKRALIWYIHKMVEFTLHLSELDRGVPLLTSKPARLAHRRNDTQHSESPGPSRLWLCCCYQVR